MAKIFLSRQLYRSYFVRFFLISLIWVLSIGSGIIFASTVDPAVSRLMRGIIRDSVSIVSLTVVRFFPLLILLLAVHFKIRAMLFLFCVLKGLALGFCIYLTILSFDSAGWMVYLILNFSDIIMTCFYFFFLFRSITKRRINVLWNCLLCFLISVIFACADYKINPLLHLLVNRT